MRNAANNYTQPLKEKDLKVGMQATHAGNSWIITDVLGGGKFKAISQNVLESDI